jgi:hypothetical protein
MKTNQQKEDRDSPWRGGLILNNRKDIFQSTL